MSSDEFDRGLVRLVELARANAQRMDELHRKLERIEAVMEEVAASSSAGAGDARRGSTTAGNRTSDVGGAQVEVVSK